MSEIHALFRATLRQFFQNEVLPYAIQWEEAEQIPRNCWQKMGAAGYLGLDIPEEFGGTAGDFEMSKIFLEELGRLGFGGLAAAFSVHTFMSVPHIVRAGHPALKQRYLPGAASGNLIGALAISEPFAGSDVSGLRTTARREGNRYILNGSKVFITNGYYADFITVAAKTLPEAGASGISLFVVEGSWPGVRRSKLKKMGWHCSDTAEIHFDDVEVPAENLIGEENKGFYYIMDSFQMERLSAAIISIAGCEVALEKTLHYMTEREAFGRPLSRFQALRHRMADLAAEVEITRAYVEHVCRLHASGAFAVKECSITKLKATELAKRVSDECLQIYGGYGFLEEYPLARMYRDVRAGTIAGGSSEVMREIVAKILFDGVAYNPVYDSQAASESAPHSSPSAAELVRGLPQRFKKGKMPQYAACVHLKLHGPGGGEFTVRILNDTCIVEEGLQGTPSCSLEAEAALYADIETGKIRPEQALFSGKLSISDLGEMMTFSSLFTKLKEKNN